MHQCGVFEIMVVLKILFKFIQVNRFCVRCGIIRYLTTIHGNKISKSFSINAVIHYKDFITLLSERSTGCFQTQNTLAIQNKRFIPGKQQFADQFAGFFIIIIKCRIQIRIGTFQTSCHTDIFPDLCRSRCHNFIHICISLICESLFLQLLQLEERSLRQHQPEPDCRESTVPEQPNCCR